MSHKGDHEGRGGATMVTMRGGECDHEGRGGAAMVTMREGRSHNVTMREGEEPQW